MQALNPWVFFLARRRAEYVPPSGGNVRQADVLKWAAGLWKTVSREELAACQAEAQADVLRRAQEVEAHSAAGQVRRRPLKQEPLTASEARPAPSSPAL